MLKSYYHGSINAQFNFQPHNDYSTIVSTETITQVENFVFVVGINDGSTETRDVVKINLHRPNEVSTHGQILTTIPSEAVATVYNNTMYVSGLESYGGEIWKYNMASGWVKCAASLALGRRKHCAAFIDDMLYICGGLSNARPKHSPQLFSVEAFNAVTDKCNKVGKLVRGVHSSGNCVPFKSSLYIFCGKDSDGNKVSHIQMYNTKQNTCTLLSKRISCPSSMMRAALWETSAILVGENTCFMFDFETETLQEREQFKTGVSDFGLVLRGGRVFVIGGVESSLDEDGKKNWKLRDDVRYVPLQNILQERGIEWKIHGRLPRPALVYAHGEMRMPV